MCHDHWSFFWTCYPSHLSHDLQIGDTDFSIFPQRTWAVTTVTLFLHVQACRPFMPLSFSFREVCKAVSMAILENPVILCLSVVEVYLKRITAQRIQVRRSAVMLLCDLFGLWDILPITSVPFPSRTLSFSVSVSLSLLLLLITNSVLTRNSRTQPS